MVWQGIGTPVCDGVMCGGKGTKGAIGKRGGGQCTTVCGGELCLG